MGRVREHVHDACLAEPVSQFSQFASIAGQGRRIAGNVDDPFGLEAGQLAHHFQCARARRVNQDLVKALFCPWMTGDVLGQIGTVKAHIVELVVSGIFDSALNQRFIAFDTNDFTSTAGQWQSEIAKATEQIEHPLFWLHVEQIDRAGDHLAVDLEIDPGENAFLARNQGADS